MMIMRVIGADLMSTHLTNAQSRILGYLISAQGNDNSGSTIQEIVNATGLGVNTVYTYMRQGIPGVVKARHRNDRGAEMYFVNPATIKAANLSSNIPAALIDSIEYKGIDPQITASIKQTVSDKPASIERIQEIMAAMSNADRVEFYIVGGQAIALLGLELLK